MAAETSAAVEAFIGKWRASAASEQANAQAFLLELCDVLGVERPRPASENRLADDYVFERRVEADLVAGAVRGRIDLYKRGQPSSCICPF